MAEGQRGLPEGMTDSMLKQHEKRRSFLETMDWELLQRLMEDAGMLVKVTVTCRYLTVTLRRWTGSCCSG